MRTELIDPRDQATQVDDPTYRVYFWADDGGANEEWELSGADLHEVLKWIPTKPKADRTASGQLRHPRATLVLSACKVSIWTRTPDLGLPGLNKRTVSAR